MIETKCCAQVLTKEKEDGGVVVGKRTIIKSFPCGVFTTLASILCLAAIIFSYNLYQERLWEYSISETGIVEWQFYMSDGSKKFLDFISGLGGGKEQLALVAVGLIFGTREKFFYFLALYTLDKGTLGIGKLAYHMPRPYMVDPQITPIHCSKEFGSPSGHSSSALSISIVVFFEVMHGMYHRKKEHDAPDVTFYGWGSWGMLLLLCSFWATCIPFSRFILGVHSADQIIFGSLIGIWNGITCHFLLRDNLIKWMQRVRSKLGDDKASNRLSFSSKRIGKVPMLSTSERVISQVIIVMLWLAYEIASVFVFLKVDETLGEDSEDLQMWLTNFELGCGKPLDTSKGLQNASLNGCSYITITMAAYIGYMNRMRCTKTIIESADSFKKVLVRILVFGVMAGFCAIPIFIFKRDMVGDIGFMWTNYGVPMGFLGWLTVGGLFDYSVEKLENCGNTPKNKDSSTEN